MKPTTAGLDSKAEEEEEEDSTPSSLELAITVDSQVISVSIAPTTRCQPS